MERVHRILDGDPEDLHNCSNCGPYVGPLGSHRCTRQPLTQEEKRQWAAIRGWKTRQRRISSKKGWETRRRNLKKKIRSRTAA